MAGYRRRCGVDGGTGTAGIVQVHGIHKLDMSKKLRGKRG